MGIFESIGQVFLHLLAGFGGFLLGTIITNIIIVKHRLKKQQEEEGKS